MERVSPRVRRERFSQTLSCWDFFRVIMNVSDWRRKASLSPPLHSFAPNNKTRKLTTLCACKYSHRLKEKQRRPVLSLVCAVLIWKL